MCSPDSAAAEATEFNHSLQTEIALSSCWSRQAETRYDEHSVFRLMCRRNSEKIPPQSEAAAAHSSVVTPRRITRQILIADK